MMVMKVDRIGGLEAAGRATVGAPPANAGGPNGPAGAPTVAAEPNEERNDGKRNWHRQQGWWAGEAVGEESTHPSQHPGNGCGGSTMEPMLGVRAPQAVSGLDRPLPHAA